MKQKLILFQPKQFNELFSTYHHSKRNLNLNPYSRVNLPNIPINSINFQKGWETAASSSRTNNSTINNFIPKKNNSISKSSYIFDKNKDIYYPILAQPRGCETNRMLNFLPYPSITQHYKKIIDTKSKEKKNL